VTTKVLLVDDDKELCAMQAEYISAEGFDVDCVHDGEAGVVSALGGDYAIVVLDVMMPRLNGVEALRNIRLHSRVPVIMLTARGDDIDRVLGLELGADDYVPKPCTPRELVARIRAILRRTVVPTEAPAPLPPANVRIGALELSSPQRLASWNGTALELTSAEFGVLELLVQRAGQSVSKQDLSEHALGRALTRYDRSIDVHISNLRQKLGLLPDDRSPIQTVRGIGYQYVAG
jgi:two-component system, OmpR family, response regulator